jgi:predicted nucleic acid-binding protein
MMPVLVDTGFIVAMLDRSEQEHRLCVRVSVQIEEPLITCEAVITESCYLLRHVDGASEAILQNIDKGVFRLPYAVSSRAAEVERLLRKYADVPMDFADGCLVDLATQIGTGRILTFDSDFAVYRWG